MRKIVIISLVISSALFLSFLILKSKDNIQAKVDEYINAYVKINKFSGSILIAKDGKILVSKGYGMANYEHNVANMPHTKFYLASVGKQFTAMGILTLVQLGKLNLQDTVAHIFPDYPRGKNITIYQLLTHTAGIPDYLNNPIDAKDPYFQLLLMQPGNHHNIIALFKNQQLEFEPSTQFKYSNSGYVLLAAIIEKVSGTSYEQWLKKTIFEPIGMHDTGLMHTQPLLAHRASRYRITQHGIVNASYTDLTAGVGDGSLYSTIEDLYKWDRALYTDILVKQKLVEQMITPCKNDHGMGWVCQNILGHRCIWHSGALEGANAVIYRFIDDEMCIIILSNLQSPVEKIGKDLAKIVFNMPYELPKERVAITVDPAMYDAYVGEYQMTPEFSLTIIKKSDRLFIQPTGQDKHELFPESETTFFDKIVDLQISFIKNEHGNVTQLILHQGENDHIAKKIT